MLFCKIYIKSLNTCRQYQRKKTVRNRLFSLVQEIDTSWNQIEYSLNLMYEKLVQLGFVYIDGQIEIIDPETEESLCHV